MKRFRFRLESVRALRDVAERRARERFGLAQQKVAQAQQALATASRWREDVSTALTGALDGRFRPAEQASGLAALRQAERAEAEATRVFNEAGVARDRAREEWLSARRRLQVMQRLEERARQAHREAADKAEQSLLDELAGIAAARINPLA